MVKINKQTKYIFVTGGVISGVGKGITAASIGTILKGKGLSVSIQKCDPYLNVDAGLLNPVEHGECFVTKDGAETDLDLGHYERFLDEEMTRDSITLSGKLYQDLIAKERSGGFGGKTVQLVPHLTDAIHEAIQRAGKGSDIHIVEIGGTVGDYESLAFIEAIRTFANIVGRENCLYISVVFVPWLNTSKEFKTKPAQNALKDLRGFGIIPDIVAVRTEEPAPRAIADKIARFAGISDDAVILLPDIKSVYEVPFNVLKSGVVKILNKFVGSDNQPDMSQWEALRDRSDRQYAQTVKVGLVAKYVDNQDTYISVTEALKAASFSVGVNLDLQWLNAETVTTEQLATVDGIVVPGGFGIRGTDGKILAADYALAQDKPYLGLCLGLQMAVIAAARRGGLAAATSAEIDPESTTDVIYIMSDQKGKELTGGTMRLGNYPAKLQADSKVAQIYGATEIIERHRHRYEVNQNFTEAINKGGLAITGTSPDDKLVEFVEAPQKKFFVATQAHPEFRSRPTRPHPLFVAFIKACSEDSN
ncbi:MAG: CTP synthase [Candidatus Saccharibacteria bacterium]|nr:CTP synthase [Candidatus Saccharibacteria bacterium]